MNAVFADTFYWIALTNPMDAAHERAREFTNDIVTTEEVLTEYLNDFCTGPAHLRRRAAMIVEAVFQDPAVRLILQSTASFRTGFALYQSRPDRGYSLTDCISMETMRREGICDVLNK